MKSKFKIGDIVNLLPFRNFCQHSGIPKHYWDKCYSQNPVTIVDSHNDYYYLSDGYGFVYDENFLELITYLPDDLFEI